MIPMWLIIAALCVVVLLGLAKRGNEWYYVSRLGDEKRRLLLPPGDMGWPFIGNMISFLIAFKFQNPDSFINNLVKRYGRTGIYKAHFFGKPSIIVSIPETCRQVLTNDEKFTFGYPMSTRILIGRKSMASLPYSEHKRVRRLISSPINGDEALAMYVGYIENIFIDALDEWVSMQRQIELLTEMTKVTFKVIIYIFLGSHGTKEIIQQLHKYYFDYSSGIMAQAINIPGFAFHKALKARHKLVEILQAVVDECRVKRKKEEKCGARGMIDLLLEVEDENGEKLDEELIINLILISLLAGHESSSYNSMWATIYLNDNPHILQAAKEEHKEIVKKRPSTQKGLSLNEIKQMHYTSKVIDETLRKTSAPFMTFREAKTDVTVNGFLIPKGWKVLVWNRGVHMDPETYQNPKDFFPSRWDNQKGKLGSFVAFGGGSWICPGASLAKLEISIFLHYLLLHYKFEQANPGGPVINLPAARPRDNCLGKLTKLPK